MKIARPDVDEVRNDLFVAVGHFLRRQDELEGGVVYEGRQCQKNLLMSGSYFITSPAFFGPRRRQNFLVFPENAEFTASEIE